MKKTFISQSYRKMIGIKFWESYEELSKKFKELGGDPEGLSLQELRREVYLALSKKRGDYYKKKKNKLGFDPKRVKDILDILRTYPYL